MKKSSEMKEIESKLEKLEEDMKRREMLGQAEAFREKYKALKEGLTRELILAAVHQYQKEYYDNKKNEDEKPEDDNDKPYIELN